MCVVAGHGQEALDLLQIGDTKRCIARLARTEQFAAAAKPQILFGEAKAILRLAHQCKALAPDLADRFPAQQQANRFCLAPSYAAAQLMKLGKPEALCLLEKRILTVRTDCVNQAGEAVVKGEATVLLDPLD